VPIESTTTLDSVEESTAEPTCDYIFNNTHVQTYENSTSLLTLNFYESGNLIDSIVVSLSFGLEAALDTIVQSGGFTYSVGEFQQYYSAFGYNYPYYSVCKVEV